MKLKTAKLLLVDDKDIEKEINLPVCNATLGNDAIDVSGVNSEGVFTLDEGFRSTASCKSKITFINGAEGILLHYGYPIDMLANKKCFEEVIFLLLHGELPNEPELNNFKKELSHRANLPTQFDSFFKSFSEDAHPMAMLASSFAALATHYTNLNIDSEEGRKDAILNIIAKVPLLAARCHRHSKGLDYLAPKENYSYAENFLYMMFGEHQIEEINRAMDVILTLHADHSQNASTSTVRLAASSKTNPFAAMAAGIASLWGPSHGGANEAVLKMLNEIADVTNISDFIKGVKDPNSALKLMGFGHRVYKNFDPRANIMREQCHKVLEKLNITDSKKLDIAMELEKIALEDSYFVDRKLYPNIDFYSGIVLESLNIPTTMFTVIFALARTTGWCAQWNELMSEKNLSISRPRQLYTGKTKREI